MTTMDDDDLPPYLDVADLVRVSELSETVVREHLKRLGLAERIGNKLMVSRYDLRDRWSSLYRTLLAKIAEGKSLRPERPSPTPPQRPALCLLVGLRGTSLALVGLRAPSWHFVRSKLGMRAPLLLGACARLRTPSPPAGWRDAGLRPLAVSDAKEDQGNTPAPEETPETTLKILEIMGLIAAFRFRRGATAKRLAKKWGVSVDRVHHLATEARKRIRAQLDDPDEIAAEVIPGMLKSFRNAVQAGDARGAAALAGQLLDVGGLKTKKISLEGPDGGPIPMIFLPEEGDE